MLGIVIPLIVLATHVTLRMLLNFRFRDVRNSRERERDRSFGDWSIRTVGFGRKCKGNFFEYW